MVELLTGKRQRPEWFISHWWGEPIADFLCCVEEHAYLRAAATSTAYWICAYANRQHSLSEELVKDPRETSFFRATQLAKGVLLVLNCESEHHGPAMPFTRIWCAFEEYVATSKSRAQPLLLDIAAVERVEGDLSTMMKRAQQMNLSNEQVLELHSEYSRVRNNKRARILTDGETDRDVYPGDTFERTELWSNIRDGE